jgi:hypothetical protein
LVEEYLMRAAWCPAERISRFGFDYQLVCALLDRWRPETHSFHFPLGEMAVTLEDVALLFGLPCSGESMGAVDPPPDVWHDDILARFAGVVRRPDAPEVPDFTNSRGPTTTWLHKYSVHTSIYLFS